jgi:RNA polymerase sigma-70 factor (ECF subfamily)
MFQETMWFQKTDEEIVVLSLKNQEFFTYLIERYEEKLFRYIRRISNTTQEDAEDILQESFLKCYRNLNGFDTKLSKSPPAPSLHSFLVPKNKCEK